MSNNDHQEPSTYASAEALTKFTTFKGRGSCRLCKPGTKEYVGYPISPASDGVDQFQL
jgi:hypothetical protein